MTAPERLEIGRIGRAHGLRGEVAVTLTSDRPERLAPGAELFADGRRLVVATSRPHQQRTLVVFEGVTDRNAAEALQGAVLTADALPAAAGELWVHELVGARVRSSTGVELGFVEALEANPASDLLVLDGDRLLPLTFVVGFEDGVVTADVPDGLWD
ncbi:MAG: ribosome maturation factor RimM [Acidimicrobiia bacterium]